MQNWKIRRPKFRINLRKFLIKSARIFQGLGSPGVKSLQSRRPNPTPLSLWDTDDFQLMSLLSRGVCSVRLLLLLFVAPLFIITCLVPSAISSPF